MTKAMDNKVTQEPVSLGELTTIASGSTFPNKFQGKKEGKIPFYKVSDMNIVGNESWMTFHNNSVDEEDLKKIKAKVHPKGTIIFPKIGAAIATNKKRILSRKSCFDNNIIGVHPSERIDTNYLYQLFTNKNISDFANTGNPPSIRKTTLENWKITLPPIVEQKRIAATLDAADALRAKRREALAQLDNLLQSTFIDMFGDPASNPMGWRSSTLGDECEEIRNGFSVKQSKDSSGVPISRIETISEGVVNPHKVGFANLTLDDVKKHLLQHGDILFSHINSTQHLCKCAIFLDHHGPMAHGMNLLRLRCAAGIEPHFLLYLIKSPGYRASLMKHENRAVNQSSIAAGKLKTHPMPVPPLDLQRRFTAIVESVEDQKDRMRAHLNELNALFASLQHRAFNGTL
ncbi:restriction endonuclease subunit S [Guyparkeria hydrothermalis]|uniref:restriction endonuclease subunit S n=1 Tax=Guyparkeria hydrothermalis TaxID=923 RepID=UPI0020218B77|nr:restriction endonuclease subunit S [Guyparkeria hydrothermalis]MCL7744255.1 restriction endonuclease subunit S [Guyparkeria hydrothermalis]